MASFIPDSIVAQDAGQRLAQYIKGAPVFGASEATDAFQKLTSSYPPLDRGLTMAPKQDDTDPTSADTSPSAGPAQPDAGPSPSLTGSPLPDAGGSGEPSSTSLMGPPLGTDVLASAPSTEAGASSPSPILPRVPTTPAANGSLLSRNLISNQFQFSGDGELSHADAASACGPVASLAFARFVGRNPTVNEALALAKHVGWTPSFGMAGPQSEVDLLAQEGVRSSYVAGVSPAAVQAQIAAGRPVILDTPNHYFAVDGYDPASGNFHVGGSGLALRSGSAWMSWDQMAQHGDGLRGAIILASDEQPKDTPRASSATPTPTPDSTTPPPPHDIVSSFRQHVADVLKSAPWNDQPSDTTDNPQSSPEGSRPPAPDSTPPSTHTSGPDPIEALRAYAQGLSEKLAGPSPAAAPTSFTVPNTLPTAAPDNGVTPSGMLAGGPSDNTTGPLPSPLATTSSYGADLPRPEAGATYSGPPLDATPPQPPAPIVPSVGGVINELPRARQLIDLGLPEGGPSGSPSEKFAAYYAQTDPSLPPSVRFGQAMDRRQADENRFFEQGAAVDPTGGVASGLASTATHLADPALLVTPELGGAATLGAGAGGLGGGLYSRFSGASPQQTAANIESGANLGLMASPLAAHAVEAAVSRIPALEPLRAGLGSLAHGPPSPPWEAIPSTTPGMGQLAWESAPGVTSGLLPGYHAAAPELKQEFHQAIRSVFNQNGGDVLLQAEGLGHGPTIDVSGVYNGVVTPGSQVMVALPWRGNQVEPSFAAAITKDSATRATLLRQDGAAWVAVKAATGLDDANAAHVGIGHTLTNADAVNLERSLGSVLGPGSAAIVGTKDGAIVLNLGEATNAGFHNALQWALARAPIEGDPTVTHTYLTADSRLLENDWKDAPNGENYAAAIANTGGNEEITGVLSRLSRSLERVNNDFASRYGWDKAPAPTAAPPSGVSGPPAATSVLGRAMGVGRGVPSGSPFVHGGAQRYLRLSGMPQEIPNTTYVKNDVPLQSEIARLYDAGKHEPSNPAVAKSYDAFARETSAQYHFATRPVSEGGMGMSFEPWTHEGQPYQNSAEMRADVVQNHHLYFFTGGDLPADHPLVKLDPTTGLTANDEFRAVHDLFGHSAMGFDFGPRGEENAWREHAKMYSPDARPAMTTETRGQNSWVNFGPHGSQNQADKANTVYADQKALVLPSWVSDLREPIGGSAPIDVMRRQRGGLAIPEPGYRSAAELGLKGGDIEHRFEQAANRAADESPDGLIHFSGEQLKAMDPSGKMATPPSVDEVRDVVKAGLQYKNWYHDVADYYASIVGEKNVPEAIALLALTSPQATWAENNRYTLGIMRFVRALAASPMGLPKTEQEFTVALRDFVKAQGAETGKGYKITGLVTTPGETGYGQYQIQKIARLYYHGSLDNSAAKTATFQGNFENALHNRFDPFGTIDTWMGQILGIKEIGNTPAGYRFAHAIYDRLARELGMPLHQAQAAAWVVGRILATSPSTKALFAEGKLGEALQIAERDHLLTSGDAMAEVFQSPHTVAGIKAFEPYAHLPTPGPAAARGEDLRLLHTSDGRAASVQRPIVPEVRPAYARVANAQAPAVALSFTPEQLRAVGYDAKAKSLPWLAVIPHHAEVDAAGQLHIALPGGNIDTARYVGSLLGSQIGHDVLIHLPSSTSREIGGIVATDLNRAESDRLAKALAAQRVPYVRTPAGDVAIPSFDTSSAAAHNIRQALEQAQIAPSRFADYQGDYDYVDQRSQASVLRQLGDRFAPSVRSQVLQERALGDLRATRQGGGGTFESATATERAAARAPLVSHPAVGGAVIGGLAGYQSDPNATPEQRARNALLGAVGGGLAGHALTGGRVPLGMSIEDASKSGTTRMYHGTGADFASPDPEKFSPNGLFGPGYYLTSDPRIAGGVVGPAGQVERKGYGYAQQQARENNPSAISEEYYEDMASGIRKSLASGVHFQSGEPLTADDRERLASGLEFYEGVLRDERAKQMAGANVRAVNVPHDLKFLNADAVIPASEAIRVLRSGGITRISDGPGATASLQSLQTAEVPGRFVWDQLSGSLGNDQATQVLQRAGYDGISYSGGKRVPLLDGTGQPIEHQAAVVFPESLPKITNAISGRPMGSPPTVGGAVVGGVAGYQSDPNASPEDKARNAVQGALGGALAGHVAGGGKLPIGMSIRNVVNDVVAPARNAAPEVQAAIRKWANALEVAKVEGDTAARQARSALGPADRATAAITYEHSGQVAANPTTEQQLVAAKAQNFFLRAGIRGRAHGYIEGDPVAAGQVGYYFPHLYENASGAPDVRPSGGGNGSTLNPRDFYSHARYYPDLQTAVNAGKAPIDSFSGPLGHATLHLGQSEADYQLIESLKKASPAVVVDTRPIPATANSAGLARPGPRPPDGWVSLNGASRQFQGLYFEPSVAKAVQNGLASGSLTGTALEQGAMSALGEAKQTLFSLSGFHTFTLLRQAVRANNPLQATQIIGRTLANILLPKAFEAWRIDPSTADTFRDAANAGVTGLLGGGSPDLGYRPANLLVRGAIRSASGALAGYAAGSKSATDQGATSDEARDRGLLLAAVGAVAGPTLGKAMTDALWDRAVPTMKVLTYQLARDSTRDPRAAATFVNQTFGGNNLAQIARSPAVQNVARLMVMAPDWWEGWARQIGGAFNSGAAGNLSRAYWLRTAALDGAFLLEGLNYALNGHFTNQNDPGKQFALETTGLYDRMGWDRKDRISGIPTRTYIDILGPIKSMLDTTTPIANGAAQGPRGVLGGALGAAGAFAHSHEGILPSAFSAVNTGVDYRGKPLVPLGSDPLTSAGLTAASVAAQVAPIGPASATQNSAEPWQANALSTLTGMRLSRVGGFPTRAPTILSPAADAIIARYHLFYTPTPPGATIRGVPLRQPEEDLYNKAYTSAVEQGLNELVANPEFATVPASARQTAFNRIEARARRIAEGAALNAIARGGPNAIQDRLSAKDARAPTVVPFTAPLAQ